MKGVMSTVCIRAVAWPLISLALLLQWPAYAAAQSIDREAIREPIWTANKQTVVKLKVSGRDASGAPVAVRIGSGVIVRSNGVIVTALHVVGDDSDWLVLPGGRRDRKIEVIGLDEHGIERPLGDGSMAQVPGQDITIIYIVGSGLPTAAVSEASGVDADFGSAVAILWDPGSRQPELVYGDRVPTDKSRHGNKLTVRMPVGAGHSGSGLFGADKKLIGIITNQLDRNRALVVPTHAFSASLPPIANVPRRL